MWPKVMEQNPTNEFSGNEKCIFAIGRCHIRWMWLLRSPNDLSNPICRIKFTSINIRIDCWLRFNYITVIYNSHCFCLVFKCASRQSICKLPLSFEYNKAIIIDFKRIVMVIWTENYSSKYYQSKLPKLFYTTSRIKYIFSNISISALILVRQIRIGKLDN